MPFDPRVFEAEVALRLVPTERMPSVAQDAVEAGFDGPQTVRMAVLDSFAGWEIDQQLPLMFAELGCCALSPADAALSLARVHASRILERREDPLTSIPYFYRLMVAGDYPDELVELGYFDDEDILYGDDTDGKRNRAFEALEELLSPELRQKRLVERRAAWEQEQTRARSEWPFVLNSPTGRALLMERYKEKLLELRPLLWIELVAWGLLAFAFSSWRTGLIGYLATLPLLVALPIWGELLRMRRERRDTLLRRGVPEDQI